MTAVTFGSGHVGIGQVGESAVGLFELPESIGVGGRSEVRPDSPAVLLSFANRESLDVLIGVLVDFRERRFPVQQPSEG